MTPSSDHSFRYIDLFKLLVALGLLLLIGLNVWPPAGLAQPPAAPIASATVLPTQPPTATPLSPSPTATRAAATATTAMTATPTPTEASTATPTLTVTSAATSAATSALTDTVPAGSVTANGQVAAQHCLGTHGTDQGKFWRVGPCDSLIFIGRQTNLSLADLLLANPDIVDPNLIFPDEIVILPGRK